MVILMMIDLERLMELATEILMGTRSDFRKDWPMVDAKGSG